MNKTIAVTMAFLLGATATIMAFTQAPEASVPALEPAKLSADTVYQYDLDQDGNMDELSYTMSENGYFELTVNGTTTDVTIDDGFYGPELTIMDIDTTDNTLDLWADIYACSDDICYSALYRYDGTELKNIWETERGADVVSAGNGILTLRYDRLFPADNVVGNHWDQVDYTVADNQVTAVATDTYKISETLDNYQFTEGKVTALTCADDLTFYTQPEVGETFTLAAGTNVTPKEIKVVDSDSCFVSFETEDGQIGWLFTGDFDWDSQPFTNMCFCD